MQDIKWEEIRDEMPAEHKGDIDLIAGMVREQTVIELIEYLKPPNKPVSEQLEYFSTAIKLLKYLKEKEK